MYINPNPDADPNAPFPDDAPPAARSLTYELLGTDPNGKAVYRGSDGKLYTDDPNGMNGFSIYTGPGLGTNNPVPPPPPPPGPEDPNHLGPLLQPFSEPFSAFSPGPSPAPFQYPDFELPTGQQALDDDPGYGFRLNQGMQALTNSASAKHAIRTGATLKNFLDYGQQLGSQEYGNAVDRRYNVWNANRGNQLGIYNSAVDKTKLDWQHGFDVWNQDFNIYKWNKTFPYTVLHDQQLLGADAASRA